MNFRFLQFALLLFLPSSFYCMEMKEVAKKEVEESKELGCDQLRKKVQDILIGKIKVNDYLKSLRTEKKDLEAYVIKKLLAAQNGVNTALYESLMDKVETPIKYQAMKLFIDYGANKETLDVWFENHLNNYLYLRAMVMHQSGLFTFKDTVLGKAYFARKVLSTKHKEMTENFLKIGAFPNVAFEDGGTVLTLAIDTLDLGLLQSVAPWISDQFLNRQDEGKSAIMRAAERANQLIKGEILLLQKDPCIKDIIDSGIAVEDQREAKNTMLTIYKLLRSKNPNMELKDNHDKSGEDYKNELNQAIKAYNSLIEKMKAVKKT